MEKSFAFNWSYLKNIEINNWFLAGGINIKNIEKACKISKKIDISSSLEDNLGVKSSKTGLLLSFEGYDLASETINDVNGGIILMDVKKNLAIFSKTRRI